MKSIEKRKFPKPIAEHYKDKNWCYCCDWQQMLRVVDSIRKTGGIITDISFSEYTGYYVEYKEKK